MPNRLCPSCVADNKAVAGTELFLRPKKVKSIYPYACKECLGEDARLCEQVGRGGLRQNALDDS